jgi:hypothetical protein
MKLPKSHPIWDIIQTTIILGVSMFLLYFNYSSFEPSKDIKTGIQVAIVAFIAAKLRNIGGSS